MFKTILTTTKIIENMHEVSIFKTVKAKQCIFNNVGFKINTLTFHKTQTRPYNQEHVLASLKKKKT